MAPTVFSWRHLAVGDP